MTNKKIGSYYKVEFYAVADNISYSVNLTLPGGSLL